MSITFFRPAVFGLAFTAAVSAASAHVVLEQPSAPAGSSYKAVLRIGHGCNGSPTTALRVLLPAGFQGAKPMPKPGWTLAVRREPLAQPYVSHGRTISDDVVEISWTATGPDHWLLDAWFDEFVLRGGLPASAGPLWFKVIQTCAEGRMAWEQVPAPGTSAKDLKAPAALLNVEPAQVPPHAH